MQENNWLKTFTEGQGKKISRILFREYNTQEGVTKDFNPSAWKRAKKKNQNKPYVLPRVNHYFQEWEDKKFIEKSKPLRQVSYLLSKENKEKLRYLPKDFKLSMLNFDPIYEFCKIKHITFTDKEKFYLKLLFLNEDFRKQILEYCKKEDLDIITATLKFYIKNCTNRYHFYCRDIQENPNKYKAYQDKINVLNNPESKDNILMKKLDKALHDKFKIPQKKEDIEFNIISLVSSDEHLSTTKKLMDFKEKMKKKKIEIEFTSLLSENGISKILPKLKQKYEPELLKIHKESCLSNIFHRYLSNVRDDKNMVLSVDRKIMNVLGLA